MQNRQLQPTINQIGKKNKYPSYSKGDYSFFLNVNAKYRNDTFMNPIEAPL